MELNEREWGEEIVELGREPAGFGPVVFHFRPTRYLKVAPDRLRDWEELFAKNVGLRPDRDLVPWADDPGGTISGSNDDWDDCDFVA
jgi:hypothetical protein